ncbi:type II CRISPR RNA-guided endonuclease Cas9 [Desulfovibrio cuneatus]|uniref:type II CRISPR RNA-guided endonuclease Cas9 n=1 Tax=Desulfovibrio cuneatus TaxID=159728 RepID=UPI00041FD486|nr:type II CRISPR RNA-guided endonuclease Cas9 [Desulfovibrio cuneatus]
MPQYYRYILGIDLGIASTGTALVLVGPNNEFLKILDMGVRTFITPDGASERRGKRMERKHTRRKRQRLSRVRLVLQALGLLPAAEQEMHTLTLANPYQLRANAVQGKLENIAELGRCCLHMAKFRGAGFLTQQEEAMEAGHTLAAPELTAEAAPVTATAKKGAAPKKDTQKTASAYRKLEEVLGGTGQTISSFFVQRLNNGNPVRRRKFHLGTGNNGTAETGYAALAGTKEVEYAVPRFLVKEEFRRMWATQRQHYPHLTPAMEEAVYDAIFQDAPHAPYATGNCTFVPGEKRLPRMHRLSETRRIYEQINHIRYSTPEGERFLTKPVRDALVTKALHQGVALTKTELRKTISALTNEKVLGVNLADEVKSIQPFSHIKAFANVPAWATFSQQEQDSIIDFIAEPAIDPQDPASVLYPEDALLALLCQKLQMQGPQAEAVASQVMAALPQGRSNLGITATRQIIEKLREGYEEAVPDETGAPCLVWRPHTHRSAADACAFMAEAERIRAIGGNYPLLPYYAEILQQDVTPIHPWHKHTAAEEEREQGRVPNPVVHVVLNQLRKVVNEIIGLYGKPQRIHVELARELGLSAKKRDELIKEMQKNERENEAIHRELAELHLAPSKRNRTKYKLWLQQGKRSLFTLQEIEASDIAACEIEHLIPRSHGGTNTFMNLCLVPDAENKAKGEQFPYDVIQKLAKDKWSEISKIIHDPKFPKAKAWRFGPEAATRFGETGDEEQTDRRLTDTRYMAKLATRYLHAVCPDIVPVKGGTTAALRRYWGLEGLEYELLGVPVTKDIVDPETGEVHINPATGYPAHNPLWAAKPRIDHRHHALDALVTACTTRAMVKKMVEQEKAGQRISEFPQPFGDSTAHFRHHVQNHLLCVTPSPKAEHGMAGQLHDATKYRILPEPEGKPAKEGEFTIRFSRALSKITSYNDIANIVFNTKTIPLATPQAQQAYQQCLHIVQVINNHLPEAEQALHRAQQEAAENGKPVRALPAKVQEANTVSMAIQLAQTKGLLGATYPCLARKSLVGINRALQFGYEPKNNYRTDFFVDSKGKVGWECIRRIDINNPEFVPQWKKDGYKRLWGLCNGDVLEVLPTPALHEQLGPLLPKGPVFFVVQKMSNGRLQCNLLHDARALDGSNQAVQAGLTKHPAYARWTTGENGLSYYCQLQARKVELTPFGKIARKHARLWHGKKMGKKP